MHKSQIVKILFSKRYFDIHLSCLENGYINIEEILARQFNSNEISKYLYFNLIQLKSKNNQCDSISLWLNISTRENIIAEKYLPIKIGNKSSSLQLENKRISFNDLKYITENFQLPLHDKINDSIHHFMKRKKDYRYPILLYYNIRKNLISCNFLIPKSKVLELKVKIKNFGSVERIIEYFESNWTKVIDYHYEPKQQKKYNLNLILNLDESELSILGPSTLNRMLQLITSQSNAEMNHNQEIEPVKLNLKKKKYFHLTELHLFSVKDTKQKKNQNFIRKSNSTKYHQIFTNNINIFLSNILEVINKVDSVNLLEALKEEIEEFVQKKCYKLLQNYFNKNNIENYKSDVTFEIKNNLNVIKLIVSNLKLLIIFYKDIHILLVWTGKNHIINFNPITNKFSMIIKNEIEKYLNNKNFTLEEIISNSTLKMKFIPTEEEFNNWKYVDQNNFIDDSIDRFGSSELIKNYINEKFFIDGFPIEGNRKLSEELYKHINKEYDQYLLKDTIEIIDIGSASGALSSLFALSTIHKLGLLKKVRITLVDLSLDALEATKRGNFELPIELTNMLGGVEVINKIRNKFKEAKLFHTNACKVPIPDNSFDITISGFTHHHMNLSSKKEASKEMFRITKHNGFIGIVDEYLSYKQYREYVVKHRNDVIELAQESFIPLNVHANIFEKLNQSLNLGKWKQGQKYYYFWCKKQ